MYSCLIELSGDVERNPGLESKHNQSSSICHWNLNSIAVHNFSKIYSLIAYNCTHHFDIIWLSEIYLNSNVSSDNEKLDIPGYGLIRYDLLSNDKRGGVCVYFKSSLPIQILSTSMLHECINLKISIDGKLYNSISLYGSANQNMRRLFLARIHIWPQLLVTLTRNHITGLKAIKPQLARLNLRSWRLIMDLLK